MPRTTVHMSEAELHLLRPRLLGGIISGARRGGFKMPLQVGPVHVPHGRVAPEPDARLRKSIAVQFNTFARTGETRQPK